MSEIIHRSKTRPVRVGNLTIGGSDELFIQSMTTTKTHDVEATVAEILRLEEAGCQIVRVACPDERAAYSIGEIKKRINIPLVVDIHFDYKLALIAIEQGADKIRINPGISEDKQKLKLSLMLQKQKVFRFELVLTPVHLRKKFLKNTAILLLMEW